MVREFLKVVYVTDLCWYMLLLSMLRYSFYLTRRPSNGKVVREGVEERYFVL